MDKYEWHARVMTAGLGSAQALMMASYLVATYEDATGKASPSHRTAARDLGVSAPTVKRALNFLRDKGFIEWGQDEPGGKNNYYLCIPTD